MSLAGALLNVVCHHYFLNMGLARTTGTNASLILGTGPVLTAISVSLIFRNFPSKMQWVGFILGLIGVSSVVLAGGGHWRSCTRGRIRVYFDFYASVVLFSHCESGKNARSAHHDCLYDGHRKLRFTRH